MTGCSVDLKFEPAIEIRNVKPIFEEDENNNYFEYFEDSGVPKCVKIESHLEILDEDMENNNYFKIKEELEEEEDNDYFEYFEEPKCMKMETECDEDEMDYSDYSERSFDMYEKCFEEDVKEEIVDQLQEFSVLHFIEASLNFQARIQNYLNNEVIKEEISEDEICSYFEIDKLKDEIVKDETEDDEMSNFFNDEMDDEEECGHYFEDFEESGILKRFKIEPSLDINKESSSFEDFEKNSETCDTEIEDEEEMSIKDSEIEDEEETSELNCDSETEEEEDEISNYFENKEKFKKIINNYFQILGNLEDVIVKDNFEDSKFIEKEINQNSMKIDIKEDETINVEVEIDYETGNNQKCFRIYEILDKEESEEEEELLSEMQTPSQNEKCICLICVQYFENQSSLTAHNLIHNFKTPEYQCYQCVEGFDSPTKFKKHYSRSHGGHIICHICQKNNIISYDLLQTHILTHSNEKTFGCSICDKKFKTQDSLRRHLQVHSDERNFKCKICDYAGKRASCLRKHMVSHSNDKNVSCNVCDQKFKTVEGLKQHSVVHFVVRNFKCSLCDYAAKTSSTLKSHMNVHLKPEPEPKPKPKPNPKPKPTPNQKKRLHSNPRPRGRPKKYRKKL